MIDINKEIGKLLDGLPMTEQLKVEAKEKIKNVLKQPVNLMIVGPTGVGKSETINALFGSKMTKSAGGMETVTQTISKYRLDDNITIWDSPGLGDDGDMDVIHTKSIIKKLNEVDANKNPLIDIVIVIIDGSSRDLGTAYRMIIDVIMPHITDHERILIAMNKIDLIEVDEWNREKNEPKESLIIKLDDRIGVLKNRIMESTGVEVNPIYYSAGRIEKGIKPYNLLKLMYYMLNGIPLRKRLSTIDRMDIDKDDIENNDGREDYVGNIRDIINKAIYNTLKGIKALTEWIEPIKTGLRSLFKIFK